MKKVWILILCTAFLFLMALPVMAFGTMDLDYNLFVGPAEFIPYRPIIVAGNNWRMVRNFGSGPLLDWGSHQFDTAQLAVNAPETCALEAEGTGEIPKNSLTLGTGAANATARPGPPAPTCTTFAPCALPGPRLSSKLWRHPRRSKL